MNNHISFKVRPVVKWFGGKSNLARRILDLLPEHTTYIEPYAGGLNVLLNKFRSPVEIVSDLNPELIHLYKTITSQTQEVLERLSHIPYTEQEFKRAISAKGVTDPVERALNFLIKHRMSRSGMGKDFSSSSDPEKIAFWDDLPEDLIFTANRLQGVQFYNQSALEILKKYDSSGVLFYMDPPYYPTSRVTSKVYDYEMSQMDHLFLLKKITSCQSNILISGYNNPLYSRELASWAKYIWDLANHSSQVKTEKPRVTEVVWVKP